MKIMITFLSAIILFLGIIPFFGQNFPIPNSGTGYSIVLIVMGVAIIALSVINQLLLGLERFFLILEGLAIIIVGALPFFPTVLTFIPREGFIYPGIVMITGILGLIYGFLGMG